MPLHPDAFDLIRANLERIGDGKRVRAVPVGELTNTQLLAINKVRLTQALNPIVSEVLFVGGHIYKSRMIRDGYSIEDVCQQIASAMDEIAIFSADSFTTILENPVRRLDRLGNLARDRVILECSARHPRAELFSFIPKGDKIKPPK
jgi:hypothetical protein